MVTEMLFSVRPMMKSELHIIANYLLGYGIQNAARMGLVDSIPDAETLISANSLDYDRPVEKKRSFHLLWMINEKPVGFCSLLDIKYDDIASIHLHIYDETMRGRGFGGHLFCLSVIDLFDRFSLKRMICEPRAENEMPNRMLRKVGFLLRGKRFGVSSALSAPSNLNTYEIEQSVAARYLGNNGARKGIG